MKLKYKRPVKRPIPGSMNKTEREYADHLNMLKMAGEIEDWKYEGIKFKLANNTHYIPDFLVVYPTHMEIHEVKGFWRDDGRVKIKVAADLFPWFKFIAVQKIAKKYGSGWKVEEF